MTPLKFFILIVISVVLVVIVRATVKHSSQPTAKPTQSTELAASPTSSPPGSSIAALVPFTRLSVSFSHVQAGQYLIRSQADWDALGAAAQASPLASVINFNQEMAIVDVMGDKPTGGYDTLINTVQDTGSELIVTLTHTSPGAGCITTQSFVYPVSVVKIAKTTKPVHFTVIDKTGRC